MKPQGKKLCAKTIIGSRRASMCVRGFWQRCLSCGSDWSGRCGMGVGSVPHTKPARPSIYQFFLRSFSTSARNTSISRRRSFSCASTFGSVSARAVLGCKPSIPSSVIVRCRSNSRWISRSTFNSSRNACRFASPCLVSAIRTASSSGSRGVLRGYPRRLGSALSIAWGNGHALVSESRVVVWAGVVAKVFSAVSASTTSLFAA